MNLDLLRRRLEAALVTAERRTRKRGRLGLRYARLAVSIKASLDALRAVQEDEAPSAPRRRLLARPEPLEGPEDDAARQERDHADDVSFPGGLQGARR